MKMAEAHKAFWANYFNIQGRATMLEFWWATLVFILIFFGFLFSIIIAGALTNSVTIMMAIGIMMFVYLIITFVPFVTLTVRRLHDFNWSGWWYLLVFIPMGGAALIVFGLIPGTEGENKYGPARNSKQNLIQ